MNKGEGEKDIEILNIMQPQALREMSHESVTALVRRVTAGDREAFKDLTARYQKKVYLLAYAFFRNHDDALDIVQDTFLKLYQKAHMFEEGKNFQNWLLMIAKNLCIDQYRKNQKRENEVAAHKNIEELPLPQRRGGGDNPASDLKDIFKHCLGQLSERQRMIFVMKHYNQLKYSEIAQILNIAIGTVKSLNFKAVKNLKVLMRPYMGEQP